MNFIIGEVDYVYDENATIYDTTDNWTLAVNNTDEDYFNLDFEEIRRGYMYTAARILVKTCFPSLVVLGTVANVLVIVVLRRGAINTDNLNIFLSVLAVVDTVFLYTSAFKTWVRVMWGFELLHMSSWSCKIGLFLAQLSSTLSAWLVLVIAWQRWYTCSRPFDRCCPVDSSKWGYAGLVCIGLILFGANSYVLVTVELHEDQWGKLCAPSLKLDRIVSDIFPYVLMALYSVLPAILLIVLNSLLARVLYTSRRSLLTHTTQSQGKGDKQVKARYNHVTVLLMTLSVTWFLLTIPHTLLKMFEHIPNTPHDFGTQAFLNVLFFVFLYINHSINFFLYCALIRSFRREVRKLASRMFCCVRSLIRCSRRRHTLQHREHHLGMSNSSINNVVNHVCNTNSTLPLLELNSAMHPQKVNRNVYQYDYHIT